MGLSAKECMIDGQLLPGNVLDARVLSAMNQVPRELFVPESLQATAYIDEDIRIAGNRYLMQPLTFARMLELADIHPENNVLVVGCMTGFSAAVISHLAAKVVAVEDEKGLAEKARQLFQKLNRTNIKLVTGPLSQGYTGSQPYDLIILEGAVQQVPQTLKHQLADNGLLMTVQNIATRPGYTGGLGKILMIVREENRFFQRQGEDAAVPLLPGFEDKPHFTF